MICNVRRMFPWLATVNLLFIALYLTASWVRLPWPIQRLADLDAEATLPAWYGGSMLLLTGVALAFAGRTLRDTDAWVGRLLAVTAIAFVFLSADEVAGIHEQLTRSFSEFDWLPRFSGEHGLWIPIYAAVGCAFLVATLPLWRRLAALAPGGIPLLALGFALLAAAVVVEAASYGTLRDPANVRWYRLAVAGEEGLELFGATFAMLGATRVLDRAIERRRPPGQSQGQWH